MSQSYGERVRKDEELINEVMEKAQAAAKTTSRVTVIREGDDIIRIKSDEPGVKSRKMHKPGTILEPEK